LWQQPNEVIKAALDYEMTLLRNIGVNTIRQYTGVPVEWVNYIYENYGIFTVLNHSFGRYGLTLKNKWEPNTDYANPLVKDVLLKEVKEMVKQYSNAPGILMFLLGNENNYGLFWQGAETENIPVKDRKSTIAAKNLYKLFNEGASAMKAVSKLRPVAICNGDLLYLDIIAKYCTAVDILGINIYRGLSFGDAYENVKKKYGKPVMLTEFGADAYNTITNTEDQKAQAECLKTNWKEIYANAAGFGKAGNSIGGFTFQFSDGWWKSGQTINLDKHDITASWSNGGYQNDFKKGVNNMNEEWFGICAKGPTNEKGVYALYPREAYYTLKEVHRFNPYADTIKHQKNSIDIRSISHTTLKPITDGEVWKDNKKEAIAKPPTNISLNGLSNGNENSNKEKNRSATKKINTTKPGGISRKRVLVLPFFLLQNESVYGNLAGFCAATTSFTAIGMQII
jgi:hypothetical protein